MEKSERIKLLSDYIAGPGRVRDFIESAPSEALTFRPELDGAWTIAEHVQHLFDAESHGYIRYRTAIVAPGSTIALWNQEAWKAHLGYDKHDLSTALEAFSVVRTIVHHHLEMIVDEDWSRYTFVHPERGTLDLDDWLTIYAGHVQLHFEYFERNLDRFRNHPA